MMKKILLVSCGGLGNGGVQAVMMSIVRKLHTKYTFDVLLFTSEQRTYDEEFLSYGGSILRIPYYEGKSCLRRKIDYYVRGRKLYHKVKTLIHKNGPYDVIHCNNEFESALILKAASKHIPIRIAHTHIINTKGNLLAQCLNIHRKSIIEQYATVKLACSEEASRSFFKRTDNVEIVNNPYDENRFNISRFEKRAEKEFLLLQIGSFCKNKNQSFSIDVFNAIHQTYANAKLIFVGFQYDGYRRYLEKEVAAYGLEKSILFYPDNADTPRLLSQSAFLLFPSHHEGFGIVLLEAQAMGVRCYASDSVPQQANCGGVQFLPLEKGARYWAQVIINNYEQTKGCWTDYDLSKFTTKAVIAIYDKLYNS